MIKVKNVTKKFGNFIAIDNMSFDVGENEIVGLLGPNGAGKSTTMNLLTGYIEPTEGKILINNFDIVKESIQAKKNIGYMPESIPLYKELTVKEFIFFMAELRGIRKVDRKKEVNNLITEIGLKDVENKIIKNISRGYKQKVSLAGALVGNPSIIILDEPTVGLDPKQILEIRNLIKKLSEKHTIIVSSHTLSEISQICNKIIIINKGKIIAVDTPEKLEKQTRENNSILITVEDKNDNMQNINKVISEIKKLKKIKNNQDGTVEYMIEFNKEIDLRSKLFNELPKQGITIFELKKQEKTLEEAFINLIDSNNNDKKNKEEKK